MSRIRSKGNSSTEGAFTKLLRELQIKGWRRHSQLPGKPDFVFRKERLTIFIHGCFWHGCPRCYRMPEQNRPYWHEKIGKNRARDRRVARLLRKQGYAVLTFWECQLTRGRAAVAVTRLLMAIDSARSKLSSDADRTAREHTRRALFPKLTNSNVHCDPKFVATTNH